eukprot:CAMPEP_0167810570 /NCGR_PEP_ID=MMETSP0112_2-20121227/160_1 /TAXON_ID=91324 /ORGANISM="Lotharella globosa, Strain CCCM811" /LENGTH=165 /DNA_ID=CAMNT_0007709133 /DNA_START=1371 /DNA_END=1868 /DNA_ORIENTATION=+
MPFEYELFGALEDCKGTLNGSVALKGFGFEKGLLRGLVSHPSELAMDGGKPLVADELALRIADLLEVSQRSLVEPLRLGEGIHADVDISKSCKRHGLAKEARRGLVEVVRFQEALASPQDVLGSLLRDHHAQDFLQVRFSQDVSCLLDNLQTLRRGLLTGLKIAV